MTLFQSSKHWPLLRFRADVRTLVVVALYFGVLALQWQLGFVSLWLNVPLFITACMLSFANAAITHNAVHSPVFRPRALNRAWQVLLTLTYGHPVSAYVPGHNLSHHKHTQSDRDVLRTSKARFRYHLLNGLFFFFVVVKDVARGEFLYAKAMWSRNRKWTKQLLLEFTVLNVVQIGLLLLDWRYFLAFWLLPHLFAQWSTITINLVQHDGCDPDDKYNHSRNFTGRVLNYISFNNGFHGLHHVKPGIHWSLLPQMHEQKYHGRVHPNLEQRSLMWYLFRTFVLDNRTRYDGTPFVLDEAGEDVFWVPEPHQTASDLGAAA